MSVLRLLQSHQRTDPTNLFSDCFFLAAALGCSVLRAEFLQFGSASATPGDLTTSFNASHENKNLDLNNGKPCGGWTGIAKRRNVLAIAAGLVNQRGIRQVALRGPPAADALTGSTRFLREKFAPAAPSRERTLGFGLLQRQTARMPRITQYWLSHLFCSVTPS